MNQSELIEEIEKEHLKQDIPEFKVGDTISIHFRIIEVDDKGKTKERVQVFTGTVIARKGGGLSETVSIYRTAYGSAMERVFPIHSPKIAKIVVMKKGKVRRGKLYHLRGIFGKKAKIAERIEKRVEKEEAPKAEEVTPPSAEETPKAEQQPPEEKGENKTEE